MFTGGDVENVTGRDCCIFSCMETTTMVFTASGDVTNAYNARRSTYNNKLRNNTRNTTDRRGTRSGYFRESSSRVDIRSPVNR